MNPAGPPPTAAAPSAPRPAAKQRLETGTVSVEFLPEGGDVGPVNLDLDFIPSSCSPAGL